MIKTFFRTTVDAIQKEEHELNLLFNKSQTLYPNHHHGVCMLYETTFVYLIFKELLRQPFPYMIHWEYPYPNKREHCDLAIFDNPTLPTLIEVKIWTQDHDKVIKSDIEKLQQVIGLKKYILILGYGGDITENNTFLLSQNPSLHLIEMKSLTTQFFKNKLNILESNELNIFLYEVS